MSIALISSSATKIGKAATMGVFIVRLVGKLTVHTNESSPWRGGIRWGSNRAGETGTTVWLTVVNPGQAKTLSLSIEAYCGFGYWWKTVAQRVSDGAGAVGPDGPSFNIPCSEW